MLGNREQEQMKMNAKLFDVKQMKMNAKLFDVKG